MSLLLWELLTMLVDVAVQEVVDSHALVDVRLVALEAVEEVAVVLEADFR